jgi:ABC-2 type transport system ATP-binding protein
MSGIAITAEGLTRDFETIRALDSLDLEVPAGSIFGYLGPNGSGKTTTINMLLGLLEPTAGSARVLGYDTVAEGQHIRTEIGAVLHDPGVYEELTAEENLLFFGRAARMDRVAIEARSRELLETLGLWQRRFERVEGWSRGMRQQLALARALLHRPRLLFLDEPTAGLDVMASTAVRDSLASLAAAEGVTIFLSTHDMTEAERLCATVAVIRAGQLVAVGSPDVLRARQGGPHLDISGRGFSGDLMLRLGAHPQVVAAELEDGHLIIDLREDTSAASLVTLVVQSGAEVEEVRRGQANLEEVFITLMSEVPA